MTLDEFTTQVEELITKYKQLFEDADGADSDYHYLRGIVDSLTHVYGLLFQVKENE